MDRRSWLWRRKSSEKNLAETESTGSVSSHSERYSDDQALTSNNPLYPEVTSKALPAAEGINDGEESLREKLSLALNEISTKEESIKQHAKIAEEAVLGWEKAEKEVLTMRQQLENANKKNSTLEDRVLHLDGALKECMRQLRQAREEQEEKIHEAVTKKTSEWESKKSELERQVADLLEKLDMTKSAVSVDYDLFSKFEILEKENAKLKQEILSRDEELELRILERDLSTQAAEAASKQNLESKKKVAKLEAECRRLKAEARKASAANALKLGTASTDSGERQANEFGVCKICSLEMNRSSPSSDSLASPPVTEFDLLKSEKHVERNVVTPRIETDLMTDFLEMERLAATPVSGNRKFGPRSDQASDAETNLNVELKLMVQRIAELEEMLEKKEAEREGLLTSLIECQKKLEASRNQLGEAALRLVDLQTKLAITTESKQAAEKELSSITLKRDKAESEIGVAEAKIGMLVSKLGSLENRIESERASSAENLKICQELDDKLRKSNNQLKKAETKLLELQNQLIVSEDLKKNAVEERNAANAKREMTEVLLKDVEAEIEILRLKVVSLEKEVENEHSLSAKNIEKCQRLEVDLEASVSQLKEANIKLVELQNQIAIANESQEASKKEAEAANTAIGMVQSNLRAADVEIRTLLRKIDLLEEDIKKERALSAETIIKYQKLEDELSQIKQKPQLQHTVMHNPVANSSGDLEFWQEKELEEASKRFSACQKTIASLSQQLKSLATLDDYLNYSEEHLSVDHQGLTCLQNEKEPWKLQSTDSFTLTGSVL